jgi:hypothetical protein
MSYATIGVKVQSRVSLIFSASNIRRQDHRNPGQRIQAIAMARRIGFRTPYCGIIGETPAPVQRAGYRFNELE